jgi:hypothetical protein
MKRSQQDPASLSQIADEAGLGASDVALIAELDESTVSRLWTDPRWLDRVTGASLQRMIASVPGVAEYVTGHALASRLSRLITELDKAGIQVNAERISTSQTEGVSPPHMANALQAALHTLQGDPAKAAAHLARLWGKDQDQALTRLYRPGEDGGVLVNPERLIEASASLVPRLRRPGYSFNAILAESAIVHHAHATPPANSHGKVNDRQQALSLRSTVMGVLITGNDFEAAQRYERQVADMPVLATIEDWSFPTYTRDARPDPGFTLSRSLLLRNTATEVIREIHEYPDAYVHYLLSVYVPLALSRDPTFGLALRRLQTAIRDRLGRGGDPLLVNLCESTLRNLEGVTGDR